MSTLILMRAPIGWNQDDFDVLEDGKIIGRSLRLLKPSSSHVMFEQRRGGRWPAGEDRVLPLFLAALRR